jgi:hypothetical protein
MLTSGSTAMDGFLVTCAADVSLLLSSAAIVADSSRTRKTWIGRVMFLTLCSPRSSNAISSSRSPTWSRTAPEMQMPPGSAST